jgi:RNA polymerase sigma-70 factor (ECF subfamily)
MEDQTHEWVMQYRNGNVEALGRLVEHFRRPLYGFILKMTEGRCDADELFQEVWFRAIRSLDSYRDNRFLSWLFRIAHNLIIDRARREKPTVSIHDSDPEDDEPAAAQLPANGPGPDREAAGRDLGLRIREAVSRLPDEQREVFLMRTEADMPFREIARIQGTTIGTALARMQYALAKLRQGLKDEMNEG